MFSWLCHRWRPAGLPGLLVALLAIASQLALGAIVLPDEASAREQSVAALDALTIFCSSATPTAPDDAPKHHHRHAQDCAICPLAVALAMPAAVLASAPALPPPSSRAADRAALPPPARGPPAQPRYTPPSRGPPVLS
jgi:hypothetical protein